MARNAQTGIVGGEERIRKPRDRAAQRGDVGMAQNAERVDTADGTIMTREERLRMIRNEWQQNVLPTPPEIPGYHLCWVATTHPTDTIARRQKVGYTLVRRDEIMNFDADKGVQSGSNQYADYVTCNEMVLMKVPTEVYQDAMAMFHHYQPREEEQAIRSRVAEQSGQLNEQIGQRVIRTEGEGFDNLGRENGAEPTFS